MGVIKFNHIQLMDCKVRIDNVALELKKYADETVALINFYSPEKQYPLHQLVKSLNASIDRINTMSARLAELSELYGGCHHTVENIVNRLSTPTSTTQLQSATGGTTAHFTTEYSVSLTMPRDMLVESWILELMYAGEL